MMSMLGCLSLQAQEKAPAAPGKWVLIWSEEFDKPGVPDKTKWTIETEFVRNVNARQIYTDRPKNVTVKNGNLVLTAFAEKWKNGNYDANSDDWKKNREFAEYTSGSINSAGKFEFMYGKVEIRAKIEFGKGVWPALWLIGMNIDEVGWPKCGEIDLLEYATQNRDFIHGTFHWQEGNEVGFSQKKEVNNLLVGYHVYGMIWTPEKIDLTFDNKVFHTLDLKKADLGDYNAFRQPFYLIMNLALGSMSEEPEAKDYPRKFMVDYVRVYQRENDPNAQILINGKKVDQASLLKKEGKPGK